MNCQTSECPFHVSGRSDHPQDSDSCLVQDSIKRVEFNSGETIFSQEQPSCCVYALRSGLVKICSITADGDEQIVGFANKHKLMVGLQSLNHERYADSAITETAVEACKISKGALLRHVAENPQVAFAMIDAINAQLGMSREMMRVMEHHGAAAKIAAFLLLVVPESERGVERFKMPLSRSEIAGILGLSEETVCRQMAKMKRAEILYAPRGSIEIHNWDRLREIAHEAKLLH